MRLPPRGLVMTAVLHSALLLAARGASAGDVELAPFAGVQFPGYVNSALDGHAYSIGIGLDYGGSLDVRIAESWRVEALYSRQQTDLGRNGVRALDLKVERYMVGIEEEKGDDPARFFGVALAGITRFAPGLGGYGSDVRFTLGLSLGIKSYITPQVGLRAEARGFFVDVGSGAGFICRGGCLFVFHASGLWQGDLTAGVTIAF